MPNMTPYFLAKDYTPGGTYQFIYSISSQIPQWTPGEIAVLESNGYNKQYPSQYCNNIAFGNTETYFDQTIKYKAGNYHDPLMQNPEMYNSVIVNLKYPVQAMRYGGATIFTSEMDFGQPQGDDVPSLVVIEQDNENRRTHIKWYKNGSLVATDTIGHVLQSFSLAVTSSGNTITGYAYIFEALYVRERDYLYTSGLKSNADVLNILNTGGYAGSNQQVYGFEDADLGEFIISKITRADGGDMFAGAVTATTGTGTIAAANERLQTICENYGWLGTDVVCYLAGTESSAEAWNFFNNDPSADGVNFVIPTTNNDGYTRRIIYTGGWFKYQKLDGDEVVVSETNIPVNSHYLTAGSSIYLTWYRQSNAIENMISLCAVYMARTSTPYVAYYNMIQLESITLDAELIDTNEELLYLIDGYDPEGGQQDDPQEEPEDIDDPAYDPLASGFLYAFMVDSNDMLNLADCLVPDTLAQKLKADFGNNLFEFIVSYHMMPCLTNGDSVNKTAIAYRGTPFLYGANNDQLYLAPITKSWYKVSCGTKVCLPTNVRADGFENWSHANVQLFLPFIGFVHLNTADVWGKTITIVYNFDILQGTCVANIGVGNNGTMYSFEGTCKYSIPFTTAIDKSNQALFSGIFASAGALVSLGGVVAGGSPAGLVNVAGGIAEASGNFISAYEHKSIINRGGCLSGSPGWNMPRTPALFITVPDCISTDMTYNKINGYPTFKSALLSAYENQYVEVGQIDLKAFSNGDGASPNDTELELINSALKGGVYV